MSKVKETSASDAKVGDFIFISRHGDDVQIGKIIESVRSGLTACEVMKGEDVGQVLFGELDLAHNIFIFKTLSDALVGGVELGKFKLKGLEVRIEKEES